MAKVTRSEAQLMVAGIRVLDHKLQRPPSPQELAQLLDMAESAVRLQMNILQDLEIVVVVDSAFETHVEIKDEIQIAHLDEAAGPEIREDLAAFDRRKAEENEKMAQLFDSGEHEKRRQEKIRKMEEDLGDFRNRKKPGNPFGD